MTAPLPKSGVLKMSDVKAAMEIFDGNDLSLADPRLRALANKKTGQISLADFYGMQELSAMIRAGVDDNGNGVGYYQSFWGQNDNPQFNQYNLIGVYDSPPDNGLIFVVQGSQPHLTFNAIIINNHIYYEADATSYSYDSASNTTIWKWAGNLAGLQGNVVYQITYLLGTGVDPGAGTLPVGQGSDWTLVFEDNFDGATLDTSKWTDNEWFESGSATGDPAGFQNYDQSGGYLRIWPGQFNGQWVHRYISSFGKFAQPYGYWEIKCRVPANKGIRCVFYLMNHDTDARPTVQPFAALPGDTTGSGWSDVAGHAIDYSMFVQPSSVGLINKRYSSIVPALPAIDLTATDHVIGVRKDTSTISFYIDGLFVFSQDVTGPNTMTLDQYIVVGIDYVTQTAADGTTVQNASGAFQIDYVRAWKFGAQSGGGGGNTLPSGYVAPMGKSSSKYPYLTFRDEFTGVSPDAAKWTTTKWDMTPNGKGNVIIQGGNLMMWPALPYNGGTDFNAYLATEGTFYQKYGYFEIRAKLPTGYGVRTDFALINHDVGNAASNVIMNTHSGDTAHGMATPDYHPQQYQCLVYSVAGTNVLQRFSANTVGYVDLSADWHTYGIEWEPGVLRWYMDGQQIGVDFNYDASNDIRMMLQIQQMLTRIGSIPVDSTNTTFGQSNSMYIDYVRCWGRSDGKTVVEGTLPPLTEAEGGKPAPTPDPAPNKIAEFYGNSTMWGYRSGVGGQVALPPPAAFAQKEPNLDVRNKAINSTTTNHWLGGTGGVVAPWTDLMAQSPAKYVFLCFGTLDQFDMSTTQFKANLKTMCEAAKANGRIPILITPFVADFSGLAAYAQAVRDCAAENAYLLLELFNWSNNVVQTGTGNIRDYIPDGTHPSDQMYINGGYELARQWDIVSGSIPGSDPSNPPPGTFSPNVPVGHPYTYTMTFQDEFDGSALNPSVWNTHIWWNASGEDIGKPVNYQVSGGELKIWPASGFYPRTIDTDGKYYQTYGFFEIEAKLPIGRGCWPAFWLYNHDGVNGNPAERPEIDIMEAYGGGGPDTGQTWGTAQLHPQDFGITMWRQNNDGASNKIGGWRMSQYLPFVDLSADYHKYGVLWEPDGLTFFFDGQQVGPKFMTSYFKFRMYILLDLYFGSSSGTPNTTETPQGIGNSYSIRYVRAWKKN